MLWGWILARLRLWCCTKNTQEMPAGTLRKVNGSEPFRTAWMQWMDAVPNVKDLEALDRAPRHLSLPDKAGGREGRRFSTS